MLDEPTERLPYFGAPPARAPRPAASGPTLRGKRVVLSTPEGFVYDMRAITEVYSDAKKRPVVGIATEEGYFRWMFTGRIPESEEFPARLVWLE